MRPAEPRRQQAERVEVLRQRRSVARPGHDLLQPRLGEMGLQRDRPLARQVAAGAQHVVRAVQRDRGADAGANEILRHGPVAERPVAGLHQLLPAGQRERRHRVPERRLEGLEQPRQRLVERAVGDHRRHDGAQPDVRIGLRHRVDPLHRRAGQLHGEVEAGGAALADQLHGRELRREAQVVGGAVRVEPAAARQEGLEHRVVGHPAAAEGAVGMGVPVHQPGHHEAAGGIDPPGALRPLPRRDEGGDPAALQEQRDVAPPVVGGHQPALDQLSLHGCRPPGLSRA